MSEEIKDVANVLKQVEDLYTQNIFKYGLDPKTLGWKDTESHHLRFEKLIKVIDLTTNDALTINDLGAGFGSLFHYLEIHPDIEIEKYYGYELSEEMITLARSTITDTRVNFIRSPQITKFADYSFGSGIFNVKFDAKDEEWHDYIQATLLQMASQSRRGIAFNGLSTYVDWQEPHLHYADPLVLFDFCKRKISRFVTLQHDYNLFEWTLSITF